MQEKIQLKKFLEYAVLEFLAKKGAKANGSWMGDTVLHIAAKRGYTETARFLIQKGAKVDSKNVIVETPLYMAAERGDIDAASFSLKKVQMFMQKINMERHYSIWLPNQNNTMSLNYSSKKEQMSMN